MFKYEIIAEKSNYTVQVSDCGKTIYKASFKNHDDAMYALRTKHRQYAMALFKACINNAKASR